VGFSGREKCEKLSAFALPQKETKLILNASFAQSKGNLKK
jgi:hypothetical protein